MTHGDDGRLSVAIARDLTCMFIYRLHITPRLPWSATV
jgi:hypothetical protein